MKRGISILVVDDEALIREAMQRLLEHDGYDVEAFPSAPAALIRLKERKFDLVITDFSMPEMDGDELMTEVRKMWPTQRIIMATAFVEEYRVFGQPDGGADALLLKPFSFKELSEAVELVMSQEQSETHTMMPPIIQRSRAEDFLPPPAA